MNKVERELKMFMPQGYPLLIEDMKEDLNPLLEPLLMKQFTKEGNEIKCKIGDAKVSYNKDFRLYMTTKMSNPHYLPEIFIKVTMINFTVTKHGLIEQLLAEVVSKEKPEIEVQRVELVKTISKSQDDLQKIQSEILDTLVNFQGEILDNVALERCLEVSAKSSVLIN